MSKFWIIWMLGVAVFGLYLGISMTGQNERISMPGQTTHGHYQIELACDVCHTKNEGVKQDACLQCHAEELDRMNDSHPVVKFKDPRNAERLERIDARLCVTCHREHQPELTGTMGLSLPEDYCYFCHQSIAEERPTHKGFGYETCATAGCHNFHDNSALYEKFLVEHLDEPNFKGDPLLPKSDYYDKMHAQKKSALAILKADMPQSVQFTREVLQDWHSTIHAQEGVNCSDCHEMASQDTGLKQWVDRPDHRGCQACHQQEVKGFLEGRHGMRLAQGMDPMTPGQARLAMHADAAHRELTCASCHASHRFDRKFAAVNACAQCHDDPHTKAYFESVHYELWLDELRGVGEPNSGVSCATCHLPRVERTELGERFTMVDHNQNNTLRPNEKMIRPACLHCHGLQFSINALADRKLIENNFQGEPSVFIDSLEMAREEKIKSKAKE